MEEEEHGKRGVETVPSNHDNKFVVTELLLLITTVLNKKTKLESILGT